MTKPMNDFQYEFFTLLGHWWAKLGGPYLSSRSSDGRSMDLFKMSVGATREMIGKDGWEDSATGEWRHGLLYRGYRGKEL